MITAILAVGNDSRGGDSWGYTTPKEIVRGLGDFAGVAVKTVKEPFFMGHTRKATQGSISVENAHPFEIGRIIGAHNGIITNHYDLNRKYDRSFTVDSMHIFGHLDSKLPLDDINGYGAIEWQELPNRKRVYLCKLDGGELAVYGIGAGAKESKGVLWSSDKDHLEAALTAAGVENFAFEIKSGQVYFIENGSLFYDTGRKLELAKRSSVTIMPDWRAGNRHGALASGQSWREGWDGDEEDGFTETMAKMMEKESEEEEGKTYKDFWEAEETIRKSLVSGSSNVDSSEFDHTHELNGDTSSTAIVKSASNYVPKGDKQYVSGKGWVQITSDGTVIEGSDASTTAEMIDKVKANSK